MKFCFVPPALPTMGRIEKEKGARVLGYILLLLGVFSFLWIADEILGHTKPSASNIEPILKVTPNLTMVPKASLLPTLFYPDGHADIPADQERFRVTSRKPSNVLLMTAPVARLSMKVVGVLCDKDGQAGMAIIEHSGQQFSYVSGEKINDSYPIMNILPDRIIINENGFYAALMLEN